MNHTLLHLTPVVLSTWINRMHGECQELPASERNQQHKQNHPTSSIATKNAENNIKEKMENSNAWHLMISTKGFGMSITVLGQNLKELTKKSRLHHLAVTEASFKTQSTTWFIPSQIFA